MVALWLRILRWVPVSLILMSCQVDESLPQENLMQKPSVWQRVIYGDDNRRDLFELIDPTWNSATRATVSLVREFNLVERTSHYDLQGETYGDKYRLCAEESFYNQPSSGYCSGFLIAPQVVVTAGHCIYDEFECKNTRIVFNYSIDQPGQNPLEIPKNEVYSCESLLNRKLDRSKLIDFAVIRLDRPVVGRDPVKLRETGKVADQSPLVVIGHPMGLPMKWADGARVINNSGRGFFISDLDSYNGNSGSPVFNQATQRVEGLLIRGASDFVRDAEGCRRSRRCDSFQGECSGEIVTRIQEVKIHSSQSH